MYVYSQAVADYDSWLVGWWRQAVTGRVNERLLQEKPAVQCGEAWWDGEEGEWCAGGRAEERHLHWFHRGWVDGYQISNHMHKHLIEYNKPIEIRYYKNGEVYNILNS